MGEGRGREMGRQDSGTETDIRGPSQENERKSAASGAGTEGENL